MALVFPKAAGAAAAQIRMREIGDLAATTGAATWNGRGRGRPLLRRAGGTGTAPANRFRNRSTPRAEPGSGHGEAVVDDAVVTPVPAGVSRAAASSPSAR
ncbi:hypothetical protein [Streptomyces sp. NPDC002788]